MSAPTAAPGDVVTPEVAAGSSSGGAFDSNSSHQASTSGTPATMRPERQTIGGGGGKKWISATPDLDDYPDPPSSYPEQLYQPVNFPELKNRLLLDAALSKPGLPRSPVWVMRQVCLASSTSLPEALPDFLRAIEGRDIYKAMYASSRLIAL